MKPPPPYAWWVDSAGWLWVRHHCVHPDGSVTDDEWHPPSTWHRTEQGIEPSFSCELCGANQVLTDKERIEVSSSKAFDWLILHPPPV